MLTLKQKLTDYLNLNAAAFLHEEDTKWLDLEVPFEESMPGVGAWVIARYGGEDQGSDYWTVWKFTEGSESVLFKFSGWYASHYGSEYEDYQEVQPKKKEVTVYE